MARPGVIGYVRYSEKYLVFNIIITKSGPLRPQYVFLGAKEALGSRATRKCRIVVNDNLIPKPLCLERLPLQLESEKEIIFRTSSSAIARKENFWVALKRYFSRKYSIIALALYLRYYTFLQNKIYFKNLELGQSVGLSNTCNDRLIKLIYIFKLSDLHLTIRYSVCQFIVYEERLKNYKLRNSLFRRLL